MDDVLCAEKLSVDMTKMMHAHSSAGHQARSQGGAPVVPTSGAGGVLRQG